MNIRNKILLFIYNMISKIISNHIINPPNPLKFHKISNSKKSYTSYIYHNFKNLFSNKSYFILF